MKDVVNIVAILSGISGILLGAASIVSFFHFWGLMVKKKYLPLWVFESSSGQAVIRLYEGLEDMIKKRRKDNPMYGEYFEWLYRKVKKRTSQE